MGICGFIVSMLYSAICGSMGAVVGRVIADIVAIFGPPF